MGSSGLLGSSLTPKLNSLKYEVITHSLNNQTDYKVNLCFKNNVFEFLKEVQPDIIINLVALTNVDYCENNPDEAYNINVKVVINITDYIIQSTREIYLLQISTDQVYDNNFYHHIEEDVTIKNVYSFSKIMAEEVAKKVPSSIIRTNFFGKSHSKNKKSLTDWVYNKLQNNQTLKAFDNVYFNPLSIGTLCSIIINLIDNKYTGIYNLGSWGGFTKAEFIIYFAKSLNLSIDNIVQTPVEKVLLDGAYRPKNMLMDCKKLENKLNYKLPNIIDEIQLCAQEYL